MKKSLLVLVFLLPFLLFGQLAHSQTNAPKLFALGDSLAQEYQTNSGGGPNGYEINQFVCNAANRGHTKVGAAPTTIANFVAQLTPDQISCIQTNGIAIFSGTNNPYDQLSLKNASERLIMEVRTTVQTLVREKNVPPNKIYLSNILKTVRHAGYFNPAIESLGSEDFYGQGKIHLIHIQDLPSNDGLHPQVTPLNKAVQDAQSSNPTTPVGNNQPTTPTVPNTSTPPTSAASFPTTSLSLGSSGPAVVQLQNYLISQAQYTGCNISAGATGYYGSQTQACVLALQKKLGMDYSSGPGVYGPRTIAALQNQSYGGTNSIPPITGSLPQIPPLGYNPLPSNPPMIPSWLPSVGNPPQTIPTNPGGSPPTGPSLPGGSSMAGSIKGLPLKNPTDATGCLNAGNNRSYNPYIRGTNKDERLAEVININGNCFVGGKSSTFGGVDDSEHTPGERIAIYSGILLNNRSAPNSPGLNGNDCYMAFRWDYTRLASTPQIDDPSLALEALRKSYVQIYSPLTRKYTFAAPVDWGPGQSTGRSIDVSPGVYRQLSNSEHQLQTDTTLYFNLIPNSKDPSIRNFSFCGSA